MDIVGYGFEWIYDNSSCSVREMLDIIVAAGKTDNFLDLLENLGDMSIAEVGDLLCLNSAIFEMLSITESEF